MTPATETLALRADLSAPIDPAAPRSVDERPRSKDVGPPAFETLAVHRDVAEIAGLWRALRPGSFSTPYQTPGLLGPWITHAAPHEHTSAAVIIARDGAGEPVALLPFAIRTRYGVRAAKFMGGSHMNYNLPVIPTDRLASFTPDETRRLLAETGRLLGVDAFVLRNQPFVWEDMANPFAALPRQASPDPGFYGPLAPSLEDHLKLFMSAKARSNQRRKMRRFEERGAPRIYRAETPAERTRLLDAYFVQKGEQFASRGIPDLFALPGVHEFLGEAAAVDGGEPAIDLYGFDLDDEVIAVTGGVVDEGRYCGMFISITSGEHAKYSPGEMLMNFVVEDAIRRGVRTFDLGVGAASYKKAYCPKEEPLFDSIFGVTPKGKAVATAFSAFGKARTWIKTTPWAYDFATRLRMLKARTTETQPAVDD